MTDPRVSIIDERLQPIRKIIAVSSGKGGVGKSLVATTLALELTNIGYKVGLFDLDFTSPTTHIILGKESLEKPQEDRGLIPPTINGLRYMSLIHYTSDNAAPLRGEDTSNALIELLAITKWNKLDYLIIDMPPGIGDAVLDLIRLVKKIEFLIVTTQSKLAFETVKKLVILLQDLRIPVIGIIENMASTNKSVFTQQMEELKLVLLGIIPFDSCVEESIGNPKMLQETQIGQKVKKIIWALTNH